MTGRFSRIQRFSTEDGPGIRTTVFLQGCNLRCPWCHNPETVPPAALLYYAQNCIGCGRCAAACPQGCHRLTAREHRIDREKCRLCGQCAAACPCGALEISGRDIEASVLVDAVQADADYYANSGGGLTLSGGEPLLQPDFCAETARLCAARGIPVLVDTAACVPFSSLEKLLPFVKEFYVDLKLPEEEAYRSVCHGSLELVKSNLRRLSGAGARVTVRVPVIPGYNDTPRAAAEIRETALSCGAAALSWLPFHRLGAPKYEAMGLPYAFAGTPPLPPSRLRMLMDAASGKREGEAADAAEKGEGGGGEEEDKGRERRFRQAQPPRP